MRQPVKVGVVGCGTISARYLATAQRLPILAVAACADMIVARAEARAAEFGVPKAGTVADLLADPEIEIVLNLTIPNAHAAIGVAALEAGKSVYNEKPMAISREEGRGLLALARARGLRVGCAPDTFLGGGLQTCRALIDAGAIGTPVAATAFLLNHGPEHWHPDPDFYYQPGAGPMFDMGPYYLTALVALIGPVRRVSGSAQTGTPTRTITSQAKYGTTVHVNTPTHIAGVLDFAGGAVGTVITSFDVWAHSLPRIEIYGTEGSLSVPDPNTFAGPVRLYRADDPEWREVPLTHGYTEGNLRALGVADMAYALRSGRPHRASGDMAYHVLDVMHAFHDASESGQAVEVASTCDRPAPLPTGLAFGTLDP